MKYIQNTGRYALSFDIVKNGLKKTIVLDRRRLYSDTGNVATTGVTAIEDDDYKLLCELEIFKKRFADKSCSLAEIDEEQAMGKPDPQASKLAEENKKLKADLKKAQEAVKVSKDAKAMQDLADENAKLKAQLENLTKDKKVDAEEKAEDAEEKAEDAEEKAEDAGAEKAEDAEDAGAEKADTEAEGF